MILNPHYYNEWEPYPAQWLRNLIAAGHLPAGDVDERSIADVAPDDLIGYRQCHFFAGIGGWALAARMAGWPIDRELWTGSCPCQPFSVAGRQKGQEDERHLWPEQFRLIRARRPDVWMGEQVAAAVGKDWLDGVCADLEGIGYACGSAVVPACAVDAPHRRDRLWIVANNNNREGLEGRRAVPERGPERLVGPSSVASVMGDAHITRSDLHPEESPSWGTVRKPSIRYSSDVAKPDCSGRSKGFGNNQTARHGDTAPATRGASHWGNAEWVTGYDGKARRVEPGIQLLAHGVPGRVGKLRAYGNAIVPQVAAEVIAAFMEYRP